MTQGPSLFNPVELILSIMSLESCTIILGLIMFGYVVRSVRVIPNRFIPAILFFASMILTPYAIKPLWLGVIHGMIYAGLAWLLHFWVIKQILNKTKSKEK